MQIDPTFANWAALIGIGLALAGFNIHCVTTYGRSWLGPTRLFSASMIAVCLSIGLDYWPHYAGGPIVVNFRLVAACLLLAASAFLAFREVRNAFGKAHFGYAVTGLLGQGLFVLFLLHAGLGVQGAALLILGPLAMMLNGWDNATPVGYPVFVVNRDASGPRQ